MIYRALIYLNKNKWEQCSIYGDALISHKHKFILFINAKCGSGTAIEWFLYIHNVIETHHINSGVDNYLGVNIHNFVRNHKTRYSLSEKEFVKLTHCYKNIIVVRNPWKRAVSFYTDKILIQKNWLPTLNILTKENYPKDITFREFVLYIEKIPNHSLEKHLQPQYCYREHINFDFVVKLENFNSEIAGIAKRLNFSKNNSPYIHRNPTPYIVNLTDVLISDQKSREINHIPSYHFFYDQDLQNIILKKYKLDIEKFNYTFED